MLFNLNVIQDGGNRLLAVDESNEHVLSVWDWAKEKKLAGTKVSKKILEYQINLQLKCTSCFKLFDRKKSVGKKYLEMSSNRTDIGS